MIFPIIIPRKDGQKESISSIAIAFLLFIVGTFVALFLTLGPDSNLLPFIFMITLILVIIVITLSLFKHAQATQVRERNDLKQTGSNKVWCASCGTEINSGAQYCSECGKYYTS